MLMVMTVQKVPLRHGRARSWYQRRACPSDQNLSWDLVTTFLPHAGIFFGLFSMNGHFLHTYLPMIHTHSNLKQSAKNTHTHTLYITRLTWPEHHPYPSLKVEKRAIPSFLNTSHLSCKLRFWCRNCSRKSHRTQPCLKGCGNSNNHQICLLQEMPGIKNRWHLE